MRRASPIGSFSFFGELSIDLTVAIASPIRRTANPLPLNSPFERQLDGSLLKRYSEMRLQSPSPLVFLPVGSAPSDFLE